MNIQTQPQPRRLRFTVDEYYKMIELGMLKDYEKAEIIEGELIQKMPIGKRHSAVVEKLNEILRDRLGKSVSLRNQQPIRFSEYDEPEPDLAILERREDFLFGKKTRSEGCSIINRSFGRDAEIRPRHEARALRRSRDSRSLDCQFAERHHRNSSKTERRYLPVNENFQTRRPNRIGDFARFETNG